MLSLAAMGLLTACDDDNGGGGGGGTDEWNVGARMDFAPADNPETEEVEAPYAVTLDTNTAYSTDFGESGTWTYSTDGANRGTLTLDPSAPDDLEPRTYSLTFDSTSSGSYSIAEIRESGTFTYTAAAPEEPPAE
jgi:hypothetical protein